MMAAFLALVLPALAVDGTPWAPRQNHRLLMRSEPIRMSDEYFPAVGTFDPMTQERAQSALIQRDVRRLTRGIRRHHRRRSDWLEERLGTELRTPTGFGLRVAALGQPVVRMEQSSGVAADGSELREVRWLRLDVEVLRGLFGAAIALDGELEPAVEQFVAERETIRANPPYGGLRMSIAAIRGFFSPDSVLESEAFDEVMYSVHTLLSDPMNVAAYSVVRARYLGALDFTLAHELGHVALHHGGRGAVDLESEDRWPEVEADLYAAWLLADAYRRLLRADGDRLLDSSGLLFEQTSARSWVGFEGLFRHSYGVIGATDECAGRRSHPPPELRLSLTEAIFLTVQAEEREDASLAAVAERAMEEAGAELGEWKEEVLACGS